MTGSSPPLDRLTRLQRDLLAAFFAREGRFTLTGGGALVGYYFGHRETHDLDLFATPGPDLVEAARVLAEAAAACGATLGPVRRSPSFARYLSQRGEERCLVDLVVDSTPRVGGEPLRFGEVRVDSLAEIAANKVDALLGRSEIRDLVDLMFILGAGVQLDQAMLGAERKDAGADPATLAWVLDQISIPPAARLPGGADPVALDGFRKDVVRRLRLLALEWAERR
ncbi:MAG TPA: nucleotidyl transferase AbiEii/AbiGii toxin family protein [Anaeromyxobacteraceae bacterium]|nr:nucleotidyl transferase AbiEii/AbiGii toxin family protein [Anaeromyxobacteraceae bacterium]